MKHIQQTTESISCLSDYDPNSLPVEVAYQEIFRLVQAHPKFEQVTLTKANRRTLANDILSPFHVPNHNNSAMDGYAIAFENLKNFDALQIVGKSLAGHPYHGSIESGQCVRITTGAIIPQQFDTIIMQEHVNLTDDGKFISVNESDAGKQKSHQHVRYAGESLKKGEKALTQGRVLYAAEIGLLASLGISTVNVVKKPKVAIITTGDEIKSLDSQQNTNSETSPCALEHGQVFDSNRYTLMAMLEDLQCDIIDFGIIKDDEKLTKEILTKASFEADIVIATGGASVGEADYVRNIFSEIGQVSFWKLAMRPGRPLSFGKLNDAIFFGLPGNPVSVMVTFYQFVKPAIRQFLGQAIDNLNITGYPKLKAKSMNKLKKRPGRIEYQRGFLKFNEDLQAIVEVTGDQGSGILSSMTQANCFIILDTDCTGIEVGDDVFVEPFTSVY